MYLAALWKGPIHGTSLYLTYLRAYSEQIMVSPRYLSKNNHWASLVAQTVKNLPAMWETWVWSLGWGDPLEEGMATHSSILAWRIPVDRGVWQAAVFMVAQSQTQLKWLRSSKAHLTSYLRMSGCRWMITPLWLSGSWGSFLYSSSAYSYHLLWITYI